MRPSVAPSKASHVNGSSASSSRPGSGRVLARPSCRQGGSVLHSDQVSSSTGSRWPSSQSLGVTPSRRAAKSVAWITVPEDSTLVQQGYVNTGPVVQHHDMHQQLLSDSNGILYDLADAMFDNICYQHDHDWSQFPEVGLAAQHAGCEELAICLAICPNLSIWAVGMAGQQRKRLQAARLAMSVALAAMPDTKLGDTFKRNPPFIAFCQEAEINVEDVVQSGRHANRKWNKRRRADTNEASAWNQPKVCEAEDAEAKIPKREACEEAEAPETEEAEEVEVEPEPEAPPKPLQVKTEQLKRDTPHWVYVEELPEQLKDFRQETLVLASEGGRKQMYSEAEKALKAMLQDDVICEDDPGWRKFPEVGEALKVIVEHEDETFEVKLQKESFTVAFSPTRKLWAVGVGSKNGVRENAAKLALAALVALQITEEGKDIPDLSETTAVADFLEEARAAKDDLLHS